MVDRLVVARAFVARTMSVSVKDKTVVSGNSKADKLGNTFAIPLDKVDLGAAEEPRRSATQEGAGTLRPSGLVRMTPEK